MVDHRPNPQVGNYVIAPGNYVTVTDLQLGNSVIADTVHPRRRLPRLRRCRTQQPTPQTTQLAHPRQALDALLSEPFNPPGVATTA